MNTDQETGNFDEDVLFSLLSGEEFYMVYVPLIQALKDLITANFLSHLTSCFLYYKKTGKLLDEKWFFTTYEHLEKKLCISPDVQRRCLRQLKDLNIVETKMAGLPAKQYFRINAQKLIQLIAPCVRQSLSQDPPIEGGSIPPDEREGILYRSSNLKKAVENILPDKNLSPDILSCAGLLARLILKNNPKHKELNKNYDITIKRWAEDIDKLHRIDKQSIEDIRTVIRWCQNDIWWWSNVLSGGTLRKQWDKLNAEMIKSSRKEKSKKPSNWIAAPKGKYAGIGVSVGKDGE